MPIARYTRMKKAVHCTLRDGPAIWFGVGADERSALESAKRSRERQVTPKPAAPIPGWHRVRTLQM